MITCRDLTVTYEGASRPSLDGVSLTVAPGELVVLAGESGCGKTTLTRCLNGLIPHFYPARVSGEIRLDDLDLRRLPLEDVGRHVASVFQDPRSQFFTTRTTTEVAFACENFGIPPVEIRRRVDEAFAALGLASLADRSVFELSSGEKQKIAIAASYALRPEVVVLDEPSANLDLGATRELAHVIALLKERGTAIVAAEHRLFYMAHLLDRLVYMRDGRVEEAFTRDELHRLQAPALAARGLRHLDLGRVRIGPRERRSRERLLLQMREAEFAYKLNEPVLKGMTLHGAAGEVIGIVGNNGSGKSTAAKVAVGLLQPLRGRVRLDYKITRAKDRLARAFFVMQEADYQLYGESVSREMTLGARAAACAPEEVDRILHELGLDALRERHPQTLSGGQKQRLTIAVGLASGADYLFLDEPTSGLDAASMQRVAGAIRVLANRGKFVAVISHDYELIAAACDRVIRMDDGVAVEEVAVNPDKEDALLHEVLSCAS